MNYGFVIDNRKCIGCHACTVACKAEHQVPVGVNRTWVKYIEKGEFPNSRRHFSVMRCNHCADAPCVEICPVAALFQRSDGIVDFDNRRCIGCKACTQACPYDALYIDPQSHTAAKCNYCAHRIDQGLEPSCVVVCPENAIISGDLDDPASPIAKLVSRQQVTARRPEKARPKLFYIEADQASLRPVAAPAEKAYLWSSQEHGVGHFAGHPDQNLSATQTEQKSKLPSLKGGPPSVFSASVPRSVPGSEFPGSESSEGVPRSVPGSGVPGSGMIGGGGRPAERRVYDAPAKGILWGREVSAYLWTKSLSAGIVVVALLSETLFGSHLNAATQASAAVFGLLFLLATGLFLVIDLDRPDRFLFVLFRPQWRSWLTRGAYCLALYGLLLSLWCAALALKAPLMNKALAWPLVITALLAAAYTAFLFGQARARDFWQSPALLLHLILHALLAGVAGWSLILLVLPGAPDWKELLESSLPLLIVINLLVMTAELAIPHATEEARATVRAIVHGIHSRSFWIGVVGLGNLIPLALVITGAPLAFPVASLLVLAGLFIANHIWVRAPQRIALC